ncbi:MAG: endonuclease/exonuclease/phosphatase family protein [Patescibacteria group bacterium]
MKILTANIGMGMPGMRSATTSLRILVGFHGWSVLPFIIFGGRLGWLFRYSVYADSKRERWLGSKSTLTPTLDLIEKEQPDVVILNEVVYEIHKESLETALERLGFPHIAWGRSLHHPGATMSTVTASKLPCLSDGFTPEILQLPQISGGAGISGVRLAHLPVTIVGFHLTLGLRKLFQRQLADLVKLAEAERAEGRTMLLAGDFNARAKIIGKQKAFAKLQMTSVTRQVTSPLGLPKQFQRDLDHIFIPTNWHIQETKYAAFGSDHSAVIATVTPPVESDQ